MIGKDSMITPPTRQMMERRESLEKEHKDALEKTMNSEQLPHSAAESKESHENLENTSASSVSDSSRGMNWDDLVEKLLDEDEAKDNFVEDDLVVGSSSKKTALPGS